jgi:GNAT superfamily N-acetyltransferase
MAEIYSAPYVLLDPGDVGGMDNLTHQFTEVLLPELDPSCVPYDFGRVQANLGRVLESDTTDLTVITRPDGIIASTVTLNRCPILTDGSADPARDKGVEAWIDDVATRPDEQGRGHSKRTMSFVEGMAAAHGNSVLLTSSPTKGARGYREEDYYVKRGYDLHNPQDLRRPDETVVYRSYSIGESPDSMEADDVVALDSAFTSRDTEQIARLLNADPGVIERHLGAAVASLTTRVSVLHGGCANPRIVGVAVANLAPIPWGDGYKPWVSNVAGQTPRDTRAVVEASGRWIAGRHGYANMIAPANGNPPGGYERRTTGLYIKKFQG